MWLAQAEALGKAATDVVAGRDVATVMGGVIALLLGAVVYLYRGREADKERFVTFLLNMTKGDADGDGKPG